ncbi:hypothetical protein Aam_046_044 [Acidocella aminolytica 101 = DSM 11237]|uniref:Uncharacterized protein n=1 Tax=Acidocella aminolytica 101 = DSM 11237 TaxID=1120923 RepID=A0A0D6PGS6_9PROT|nr:hypothetical protein Aam_046_044 [Acidocella aminolytica 101 = DSM 11237]GBQ34870.1 hypothetical protein AA11237_0848 [Acidocella aminolytica 101 = DSM 11237]
MSSGLAALARETLYSQRVILGRDFNLDPDHITVGAVAPNTLS